MQRGKIFKMKVTILTESELRKCVSLNHEVVEAIGEAFTWLAEGKAYMPPIMHIPVPENNGDFDFKSAHTRGLESLAVKLGAGFFDNRKIGLPNATAMVVLLNAKTGFARAVLLDNGYLTDVRTGAAGAVAAKHLSRENIENVGVIGAGAQGRYQMLGLRQVRSFKRLMVYDLDETQVQRYIQEMSAQLDVEIVPAMDVRTVFESSDIVVTTTPAKIPYVKAEWLRPGLHITCMGADLPEKQELEPDVLTKADVLVCDRKSQCFKMGELHHGLVAGVISEESEIIELGEVTSGRVMGRQNNDQITICDLTGTGVQDTAISLLAYKKATEMGLGIQVDNTIG
jgi:ornithine cyclodeaminase